MITQLPNKAKQLGNFYLGEMCLCRYASLPLVFDWIKECHTRTTISENLSSLIVVVVSPLTVLTKDQVESFSKRGQSVKCSFLYLYVAELCKLFYTILQFKSIAGLVQYTMCE